jgi:hypothetical protein
VHGLIAVREELRRQRGRAREVLVAGHRRDQGADVGDQRQTLLPEQALQPAQVRVQSPLPAVAARDRRDRPERSLRQRQAGPRCGIARVAGAARHEHVVAVVAAVEEHAHQRFEVAVERRGGGDTAHIENRGGERRHADGGADGAAQELAA